MILQDGSYHPVDSSEMAFRLAAMAAIREYYNKATPTILEPIMKVEVSAPEEFQGQVIGQLNQRRGVIIETSTSDKYVTALVHVPFSEMFGYSTDLRSATQGKGEFTMEFEKYEPVPRMVQEELMKEYQKKRAEERK
jgi:elongation factor G